MGPGLLLIPSPHCCCSVPSSLLSLTCHVLQILCVISFSADVSIGTLSSVPRRIIISSFRAIVLNMIKEREANLQLVLSHRHLYPLLTQSLLSVFLLLLVSLD